MSIAHILKDTPIWVWILFVFLIRRGISALSDRKMRIERLFLLPMIFLIWGVYSLIHATVHTDMALLFMLLGLVLGIGLGWMLWRCSKGKLRSSSKEGYIIRPGTPLTLGLILLFFVVKFVMTAMLAINTALVSSMHYNILFGFITGLLDGVFWGGTLNLFIPWYLKKEKA